MAVHTRKNRVRNYADIRAKLIKRGASLFSWAKANGQPYTTVVSAARGDRAGNKSRRILEQLKEFLNE
jgi:hypothetical protein